MIRPILTKRRKRRSNNRKFPPLAAISNDEAIKEQVAFDILPASIRRTLHNLLFQWPASVLHEAIRLGYSEAQIINWIKIKDQEEAELDPPNYKADPLREAATVPPSTKPPSESR